MCCIVVICQALEETSKKAMTELQELMRYHDYWNERLNQVVSWRYRDRCRSDSSPVSVSDSTSSEQGLHLMQHFRLVCTLTRSDC